MRQFFECLRQTTVDISPEKRLINIDVHFFEGMCLFWESCTHLLSVVSTLCVCVRHVLQGALFLLLSTVRWQQKRVLGAGKEEWEKNHERQRQAMLKEGEQVEEFLAEYCQDAITSVNRRRRQGRRTGRWRTKDVSDWLIDFSTWTHWSMCEHNKQYLYYKMMSNSALQEVRDDVRGGHGGV